VGVRFRLESDSCAVAAVDRKNVEKCKYCVVFTGMEAGRS